MIDLGEYLILSEAEEKSGGRKKASILEDTFEALIGAIYHDGGYKKSAEFIERFVLTNADSALKNKNIRNYKSELLELLQGKGFNAPTYKQISVEGPEHKKSFTMAVCIEGNNFVEGTGFSKKLAEQNACCNALEIISDDDQILTGLKKEKDSTDIVSPSSE